MKGEKVYVRKGRFINEVQLDSCSNGTQDVVSSDDESTQQPDDESTHITDDESTQSPDDWPELVSDTDSKVKKRNVRGSYKSISIFIKTQGVKKKLKVDIPEDKEHPVGEHARDLANMCGLVVRDKAPLNVNNWEEAFTLAGDQMLSQIQVLIQ
ncbi:hypothetical protein SLA2020_316030 [Shorea laevis]